MLPKELNALPSYAQYEVYAKDVTDENTGDVLARKGHVVGTEMGQNYPRIAVNADEAYPAILTEYRTLYESGHGECKGKEWDSAFAELAADDVCAYWLETCFQGIKMDVQRVAGFGVQITMCHPSGEAGIDRWKQANAAAGRDAGRAAGNYNDGEIERRGTEARQHYKRLRGFLVA